MIELTIKELVNSVPILKEISEKKMPAKTAYQFARLIKEADIELQSFQEARNKLIERYGKKDNEGKLLEDENGNIIIFPDKEQLFQKEADDLLNMKININCEKINIEDIIENEFSPNEISELLLFIKE